MVYNSAQSQFTKAFPQVPCESKHTMSWCFQIQLKPACENPLSKFFIKMTDDKCRSQPGCSDPYKESLPTEVKEELFDDKEREESAGNECRRAAASMPLKNEPVDTDTPMKLEFEEIATDPELNTENISNSFVKDGVFPVKKRELEDIGTDSGQTTEKVSNFTSNPVKKGRSNKNSGDKQATLLSYFGKS